MADVSIRRSRRAVACPEADPPLSLAILEKARLVFTEIKIRHLGFVGFNRLGGIKKRIKAEERKVKRDFMRWGSDIDVSFALRCQLTYL